MPTYEVEHKWTSGQMREVQEKLRTAISMAKTSKGLDGVRPVVIFAIPGEDEAHSVWAAPSKEDLEQIYQRVGLETSRTIREVNPLFPA
ncbi:MAG: hypothetical protein WB809_01645 [Thermoplasmata archaeon]